MRFILPLTLVTLQLWLPSARVTILPWGAWAPVILTLFIFPILDLLLPPGQLSSGVTKGTGVGAINGVATTNGAGSQAHQKWFYDGILVIYSLMHVACILKVAYFVANRNLTTSEMVGLTISTGIITGGIGITFAHELIHRRSLFLRSAGELILVFVCYGHFAVAHVLGHHRNVGTAQDPATAREGEWLALFLLRALPGTFLDALHLKRERTLIYTACSALIASAICFFLGPKALAVFLGQALMAAVLLETVDYIEHYGLTRKELAPGRYEMVRPEHSWDSNASFSGALLVNLQRHADHHMHVLKEYPQLELLPEARQLPTGYPGMIWLAMLSPKSKLRQRFWSL